MAFKHNLIRYPCSKILPLSLMPISTNLFVQLLIKQSGPLNK